SRRSPSSSAVLKPTSMFSTVSGSTMIVLPAAFSPAPALNPSAAVTYSNVPPSPPGRHSTPSVAVGVEVHLKLGADLLVLDIAPLHARVEAVRRETAHDGREVEILLNVAVVLPVVRDVAKGEPVAELPVERRRGCPRVRDAFRVELGRKIPRLGGIASPAGRREPRHVGVTFGPELQRPRCIALRVNLARQQPRHGVGREKLEVTA